MNIYFMEKLIMKKKIVTKKMNEIIMAKIKMLK
jgi:hypothetical protein